jgi:hypothetical protein
MNGRASIALVLALLGGIAVLGAPSSVSAQQPKMDVKLFFGFSGTTFVSMLETGRERDTFAGWQIGFGPRLRKRVWFVEALFSFNRWAFAFNDPLIGAFEGQVNSFELPLLAGYIPYKSAYFKLFLYGGYVNHFNTKIIVNVAGGPTIRARPKEVDFAIYQALARFGVNFDIAMFNFDFNYSISLNSATSTSYRTGYHQIQLNLAYLF